MAVTVSDNFQTAKELLVLCAIDNEAVTLRGQKIVPETGQAEELAVRNASCYIDGSGLPLTPQEFADILYKLTGLRF